MHEYLIPLLLAAAALAALHRREDIYALLTAGAAEGLQIVWKIFPPLVVLLSAVSMLRASGAVDALARLLEPVCRAVGIPAEAVLLMLLRPLSGSAALAVGTELICTYGPDSPVGRTAAVMLGSTETTFYVISVYFGACGIRSARYAPLAALCADLVGFLASAAAVRWIFP